LPIPTPPFGISSATHGYPLTAAAFIEQAAAARRKIAVSSISLAKLVYLVEKGALLSRATPKVITHRLDRAETTLFSS
jgi:hypothetical protein